MAKSDTPFNELDLSKVYTGTRKAYFTEVSINGFDTETADGNIFAISAAIDGFSTYVKADKEFLDSETVFDVITTKQAENAVNVWYNLNFDANVILNHLLSELELAELSTTGRVELENYRITFIPSKFLKISSLRENKNGHKWAHRTWTHYDVSQFFYGSLESASEEWLGKEKLTGIADTTKFGSENNQVNDYILEHWDNILTYARKDAQLVKELWEEAVSVGENLDIPMGKPFSTGYLAEAYLNEHLGHKPGITNTEIASLAWETYSGGRFEVIKRGFIGDVSGPDINSAYPFILQQLPDPKTVQWKRRDSPSIDLLETSDIGFLDIAVTTDSDRPIQPFAVKIDSKVMYPALDNYRIQTIKDIFLNALEYGYIEDYTIHEAWLGFCDEHTVYPFTFIDELYNRRKDFEAHGHFKKGQLLKIILNSMYGKTCQTTPKIRELEENDSLEDTEYKEHMITNMELPMQLKDRYQDGFVKWLQAGSWFNPILATYITGMTRLELHKRILEYGLEYDTVMLATDSLMIEQKPFEKSGFANDLVKDGLGNWDYDYTGKAYVIGAGVYEIEFDKCRDKDCDYYNTQKCDTETHYNKTKTRGFNENDLYTEFGTLKYASKQANGHIPITSIRPRTIAEAIWQNESLDSVGVFDEFTRKLKPDFDTKRNWPHEPGFADLLNESEGSTPLRLAP